MDSWEPHLHWSFRQEHVLLRALVIRSFPDFILAGLFLTLLCALERLVSFILERHWSPSFLAGTRWGKVVWRTVLYWVATFLRLLYMLAAMTFQLGIIIIIVTSLASGQLLIEYYKSGDEPFRLRDDDESQASSIQTQCPSYPLHSVTGRTRPRSRSKPQDISIHPADSNIARANAVASQLGIDGDAGCMQNNMRQGSVPAAWKVGEGRLEARKLLGNTRRNNVKEQRSEESFLIGGSDSDSESS